jgi:hypothetical protein
MIPFSQAIVGHASNAVNGVVVGIPMAVAGRQRSRRNSLASAPMSIQHRQRCSHVMRASLDGQSNDRERDMEHTNDEEILKTHNELMEIEQQLLMMMGHGVEGADGSGEIDAMMSNDDVMAADSDKGGDDSMSVGSYGSTSDLVGLNRQDGASGRSDRRDCRDSRDRNKRDEDNRELYQDFSQYSSSFTSASQGQFASQHGSDRIDEATKCYVILFGMGSEETEGIYTLRTVEACHEGDVVNVDTVVAFEDELDAQRFATLLEASLRHQPAVYSTSWGDITEWSKENAARCRLEPSGSLLLPPESNVSVTDWERALALQRGQYTVLDEEPDVVQHGHSGIASLHDDLSAGEVLSPSEEAELFRMDEVTFDGKLEHDNVSNIVDSRMANSSLNSVREELERLLGSSS